MKKGILTLLFLLFVSFSFAQRVLKVNIDKNKVKIGEEINLIFTLNTTNLKSAKLLSSGESQLIVKDKKVIKKSKNDIDVIFKVVTFDKNIKKIGPFILKIYPSGKEVKVDKTFNLKVLSSLSGKEKDICDIKSPLNVKFDYKTLILLVIILFLVIILLVYILKKILKKVGKKGEEVSKRVLPPLEEFNINYEKIRDFIDKGEYRNFYFQFSEIVRRYLERRWKIPFLERTTSEILRDLGALENISQELKENIKLFLKKGEPIKYAGFIPLVDETEKFRDLGLKIVSLSEELLMKKEEERKVD